MRWLIRSLFCCLALSSYFSRDSSLLFGLEDLSIFSLLTGSLIFRFLLDPLTDVFLRVSFSYSIFLVGVFLLLVTTSPYLFLIAAYRVVSLTPTEFSNYFLAYSAYSDEGLSFRTRRCWPDWSWTLLVQW